MRKVEVRPVTADYDILIDTDVLDELKAFIKNGAYSSKALIVSDSNVGKLYGKTIKDILKEAGLTPLLHLIKAGEMSKTLKCADEIFTLAIENGLDRRSLIIALGGGVVGDLTGFIAATYMRGVPFLQIPTSLLAQVDSSVGGKVAVNHRLGKNLIGAFYQPEAVFINLNFLKTLPKREIYTGLGEIVKYGIIYDEDFFRFLEDNVDKILALDDKTIEHVIARSCEIKAEVVSQDEKENGLRAILNFGHTVGHTIEKETHYMRYNHGEAVAVGIQAATAISLKLGMIDIAVQKRITALISAFHLPLRAEGCQVDNMIEDLFHDKKTVNGTIKWVLIDKIGHTVMRKDVPLEIVREAIEGCIGQ